MYYSPCRGRRWSCGVPEKSLIFGVLWNVVGLKLLKLLIFIFFCGERDSRAPTSLRSPTSNAHTLPRASSATQNEEVAGAILFFVSMHISIQQVDVHVPIYKKRALSDSFFIFVLRRERDSLAQFFCAYRSRPIGRDKSPRPWV